MSQVISTQPYCQSHSTDGRMKVTQLHAAIIHNCHRTPGSITALHFLHSQRAPCPALLGRQLSPSGWHCSCRHTEVNASLSSTKAQCLQCLALCHSLAYFSIGHVQGLGRALRTQRGCRESTDLLSDGICECHPLGAWMEVEEPMSYAVAFHVMSLKPLLTSCADHCKPTGASEVFSWKASVICSVLLQDFRSAAGI